MPEEQKKENIEEEFKKKFEECLKQKEEYLAGWQRSRADFINHKREEMERMGEILKYANEELILKILPILDNFEIAENKIPEALKNDDNVKGLLFIKNQVLDFLKSQGVEEMKTVGEKFNPNFHEVIQEIEEKEKEPGIIIEEVKKGYKVNGQVLRPAKVKIAK